MNKKEKKILIFSTAYYPYVGGAEVAVKEITDRIKDVEFDMSLSNTCLSCHTNKAEFCDKCHGYASVDPYCWDCHVDPNVKED